MDTVKTKIVELPTFEQLTEEEKAKVIYRNKFINIDGLNWWKNVYADASRVGISIQGFDIDRKNRHIHSQPIKSMIDISRAILKEHGILCETHNIASEFIKEYATTKDRSLGFFSQYCDKLKIAYLKILQDEYDHLTSDSAVIETLKMNEYTFNRDTLDIDS